MKKIFYNSDHLKRVRSIARGYSGDFDDGSISVLGLGR